MFMMFACVYKWDKGGGGGGLGLGLEIPTQPADGIVGLKKGKYVKKYRSEFFFFLNYRITLNR